MQCNWPQACLYAFNHLHCLVGEEESLNLNFTDTKDPTPGVHSSLIPIHPHIGNHMAHG